LKFGWLAEHKTTTEEIRELLGIVERDLVDAGLEALSDDWKLNIAPSRLPRPLWPRADTERRAKPITTA